MGSAHIAAVPMPTASVKEMDLTGPHGGLLALSFAAGCVFTAGLARLLWGWLVGPMVSRLEAQIAKLETELAAEQGRRREDRERCDREVAEIRDHAERRCAAMEVQLAQLQSALLAHGPASLRQAVQAVVSEARVVMDHGDAK